MTDLRLMLLVTLVAAGLPAAAAAQLPVLTPTPTPAPSATPSPEPTPSPTPAPPTLTLVPPARSVGLGHKVRIQGQASVDLAGMDVYLDGTDPVNEESTGWAKIRSDGSFTVTIAPHANGVYRARYGQSILSNRIHVFVHYGGRVRWRHRSRGRIEALAILDLQALDFDTLGGHRLFLYGFDGRRDTTARRLGHARLVYTDNETSTAHPGAYFNGRVPGARRVRFLLVCVPFLSRYYGAPDDPVRRGCGRPRIRFQANAGASAR